MLPTTGNLDTDEASARVEEILSAMGEGCMALDREWCVVYANAEAGRLMGEPAGTLIGRDHWEKWPETRATRVEEEYRQAVHRQTATSFEYQFVFPDGRGSVWLEIRAHPSALGGLNIFFRDISDRKRSEANAAERLKREMLINRIAEAAIHADEARPALETAVSGLADALGLDRCYYVLHDPVRHVATVSCEWRRPGLSPVAGEYPLADYAEDIAAFYKSGGAQVIHDASALDQRERTPLPKSLLDRLNLTALIRSPLSSGSAVTALVAAMTTGPREWTPEETALVQSVAAETAEVMRSLQVQERHRRIATVLQEALQPGVAHNVPGMQVAAYLRPALDEANVGGDFYDVFPIAEDKYAFVIGDVSGKGLEAAAQVSTVRNLLRAFLYQGAPPARAASELNAVVCDHDLLVGFATLFIGVYDAFQETLSYASCGHEPPILLTGATVQPLKPGGAPIGAYRAAEYAEERVELQEGDILAMYTDGLSEAGPDLKNLLGSEGLTAILRGRASHDRIEAMAAGVVADVVGFANGRLRDDACLVMARRAFGAPARTPSQTAALQPISPPSDAPALQEEAYISTASGAAPAPPRREMRVEEQFRLLVESVTDYAIFLLDPDGYIKTWNKGAERAKGYAASEAIGKHFSIFYTPEDVQRGHPLYELTLAIADGHYEEEGWRVRKDGSRFWANVVITALKDDAGMLYGFAKVTRDFTERRRAEQQLRRSEERFRLLVQGVRDYAIFMMNPQGIIASWNEGAQRIKGYTPHEIVGRHFSTFYTADDIAAGKPDMELAVATAEGRYEEEGWRVRKDGSHFWANVVITALKDDAGMLYGFAKVTRDFTERRHAEETRIQNIRERISRSFLRDILYSVTEGRLRFCENESELPARAQAMVEERDFDRHGLAEVRADLRSVAASAGMTGDRLHDIITAVSEAAMNAVVHADRAHIAIGGTPGMVQVWIVDHGRGIELSQLHRATLERGYTTEDSLGHGFWLMLQTCDRIWLHSTSAGTTLVLEQEAATPEPAWMRGRLPIASPSESWSNSS